MKYFIIFLLVSGGVFAQSQNPYLVIIDSVDNSFNNHKLQLLHGRIDDVECDIIVSTSNVFVDFKVGKCYYLLLDYIFDEFFINYKGDTIAQGLNLNIRDEVAVKCSNCTEGELIVLRKKEKRLQFNCLGVLVTPTWPKSFRVCD